MTDIIRWLTSYNSEYDIKNKTLRIRKPMPVAYFITLRKILEPYKDRIEEIIVEG